MSFKNMILYIKSANEKLENKFDSLSKLSSTMLIFGQFFLMLILLADLIYAVWISYDARVFVTIFESVQVLFVNAASGLCVLWLAAIFLDYIDKKDNS